MGGKANKVRLGIEKSEKVTTFALSCPPTTIEIVRETARRLSVGNLAEYRNLERAFE